VFYSEIFNTVNFPGGSEVKCIDGLHLIFKDSQCGIKFDMAKDLFVCAEQCIAVLAALSPILKQHMSMEFVTHNSVGVYQLVNILQPDQSCVGEYLFIPLSLLMGLLLLVIHKLDIPLRLRLFSFIGSMNAQCVKNYPVVGRVQVIDSNNSDSGNGSPRLEGSRFHELGITVEEFEDFQKAKYADCYRLMRGFVSPNITRTTLKAMIAEGLPPGIANRIWSKRVLWLLCVHPTDLPKIHMADLRSRYAFHGLDLVEMRALWHCLPAWNGDNPKAEWKREFKRKLDSLAAQEITGEIDADEARNPAYDVCVIMVDSSICVSWMFMLGL
jgi:hypothetical protein